MRTLTGVRASASSPFVHTVDTDSSFKESRGPTLFALSLRRACDSAFLIKAVA